MNTQQHSRAKKLSWLAGGLAVAMFALPGQAKASDRWSVDVRIGPGGPAYEWRTRQVWVPPEYVERVVDVEIPPVVRTKEVPIYDRRGRIVGFKEVTEVVAPARIERRVERVLVREGYYKEVRERVPVRHDRRTTQCHYVTHRPHDLKPSVHVNFDWYKDWEHKKVKPLVQGPRIEFVPERAARAPIRKVRR
jgi:hypothetical protein